MTPEEYEEWREYNREEPFPWESITDSIERMEGRVIWMMAQYTALLANINRGEGKNAFDVKDFVPVWRGEEPVLTEEEEMMQMDAKFDAFNAKVAAFTGA